MENKHTQQVDFSNPNADKITSAVTNTPIIKLTAVKWLIEQLKERGYAGEFPPYLLFEQAKSMEKEQMIGFAEFVAKYPDKNRNYLNQMLHARSKYDGAERTVDLLEEYYNETYGK